MFKPALFQCFNRTLALSCILIAISTFNYGFDNQAFSTTQAMTPFTKQFGTYNPKTKTYHLETYFTSLFNSLQYIGFGVGVIIGSKVSSHFGRRWCMFSMSCWALVTATIAVTSSSRWQILSARMLNYVYIGMELSVVPIYQSEIVPARARGFVVATYQLSLILGGLVINSVCRGTSTLPDNRAWRIPLGCFYIIPSIIISLIWFVPESPRWLLSKGRTDDARKAMNQLRAGTSTDEEIEAELAATQYTLDHELERGTFAELWQGVNLKRTLLAMGVNFSQQATGQAFASQYGAIFIKSLNTVNTFDMTLINSSVNAISTMVNMSIVDRVGRKPLLLTGAAIQVAGLFTMGGLGTVANPTLAMKNAIVAMLSVFLVGFSIGWAPLTYVITTELPALHLRDQTQQVASLVNVATSFVVSFTVPYLLNAPYANLGSKVGFIYGSIAFCTFIFTWFCIPECKGKTLEEIDFMFNECVPVRQFDRFQAQEHLQSALGKEQSGGSKADSDVHIIGV
ncbi:putative sugar transporter-1 [Coleophoma cylindrospora]|uniref:Putative sugar transporter-1 n=1 Tax=Coleophoma cylindrospora TaxID=1849047 RepID=A0A3D8SFZ1_9HELO|nr:putative sugar transporter-1 [Coleophoma cylindrospora]